MVNIDDFIPITLDAKPIFDSFYQQYPPIHSDYLFTTMISWFDYAHYSYTFVDKSLMLKICIDDVTYFRPPIGNLSRSIFDQLITLASKEGNIYPVTMITEDIKTWINMNYPGFKFEAKPEYDDYVYRSSDLASLEGSDYRKIRNRLNKFRKNTVHQVEHITMDNTAEVKGFLKRWCIWKECEDDPLLTYEKKAVNYAVDHFEDLGLSGIAIRVNDRIEAISIYEHMKPDMVVVHFEKGSPDYDGIYKLVNMETAKSVQDSVVYINRESDMGNPGLRKAKRSYRPDHMVHVFHLRMQ